MTITVLCKNLSTGKNKSKNSVNATEISVRLISDLIIHFSAPQQRLWLTIITHRPSTHNACVQNIHIKLELNTWCIFWHKTANIYLNHTDSITHEGIKICNIQKLTFSIVHPGQNFPYVLTCLYMHGIPYLITCSIFNV